MIRIIFVGIYHKPGLQALDSATKTGRSTDYIIQSITSKYPNKQFHFSRTNLFNTEYLPAAYELYSKQNVKQWAERAYYKKSDIVICFGKIVQAEFRRAGYSKNIINAQHPSFAATKPLTQTILQQLESIL